MRLTALLEAYVIVGADPGEQRDLFAAQARHPAAAVLRQAHVLGFEGLAPGSQKSPSGVAWLMTEG
ncbi:hypothetical protein Ade02nite_84910 [Paractinoplanes deccanensis]|uniref:Uncharacterized protein n=1 Tax=Paractinoplanes deccanensis TaxID=113561 RepID=A0ABQ3YIL8_9ACTN|nr:hypothetical protein Ade02nite_84910 [Actinoplanes deccanensis]